MATPPIKTCMTKDVVWVSPDMTMGDAAHVLVQRKMDCLPVVDKGTLVGVVTARDCGPAFLPPVRVAERGETSQRTRISKRP